MPYYTDLTEPEREHLRYRVHKALESLALSTSAQEVIRRMGVAPSTIYNWRAGLTLPAPHNVDKLISLARQYDPWNDFK